MRLRQKNIALFTALILALTSCVTHGKKTAKKKRKKARLTSEELVDGEPIAPSPKTAPAAPPPAAKPAPVMLTAASKKPVISGPSPTEVNGCENLVNRFAPAFRELHQALPPGTYTPDSDSALERAANATTAACQDSDDRSKVVQAITDSVNQHSGRIGVILPLSGDQAKLATYIVNGLRAAYKEAQLNFDQQVVLKDSAGNPKIAETRLAELIFKDKVALVIGGFEPAAAQSLAKWSERLMVPAMILNRNRDLTADSHYAFMLYPDEKRLAETLARTALKRGIKRIAVLKPTTGKSDRVTAFFKEAVNAAGGQVAYEIPYTPNSFESMAAASRELFKDDPGERQGEFKEAYKRLQKEAEREHVPFNPKMVVLKPIVDFDAVFVPDDFRTARYFAKLFRYHMVDHLTMIGNHEWRSPALIDPYDDFLKDSFFADFIGNYNTLPPSIGALTTNSPYFVEPQNVVAVDFRLIGYRAGRVARLAMEKPAYRRLMSSVLNGLASSDTSLFDQGKIFDGDRHSNWPTYVFTVQDSGLSLETASSASFYRNFERKEKAPVKSAQYDTRLRIPLDPFGHWPETSRW